MTALESTIQIAATREQIWPVMTNVQQWPTWTPTVTSVEGIDSPALALGARFKVVQPKLRPALWIVTRIEPDVGFVWESKQPGVRVIAEHMLGDASDARTTVTLRIRFLGLFGPIVGYFARTLTEDYLAKECVGLKQRIESRS